MKKRKKIFHLDFDSFFASVEQQENPYLRGKPVGVVKAEGRTCIIAASIEAKRYGVKTGCSVWEGQKLCPSLILVPADFEKYFYVTKQFLKIIGQFSPVVEAFSLDEAFLDISPTFHLFGSPELMAFLIKREIDRQIGGWITCSIGFSYNKLLAKLASDMGKPDGFFKISRQNRDLVLSQVKLTDICGLGFRLEAKLKAMGIHHPLEIRKIPLDCLKITFGPYWSKQLRHYAFGHDVSAVNSWQKLPEQKSVSRTFTLFSDTHDLKKIRQTILNLVCETTAKARQMHQAGRQVGLVIRGGGADAWNHRTLKSFTNSEKEVFSICWQIFQKFNWHFPVRFIGVWLSLLEKENSLPVNLFPWKEKERKVFQAVDDINRRFGTQTIYPSFLQDGILIRPEVNGYLGDKKFRLES